MSESFQRRLVMLFCLRCGDVLVTLRERDIAFALRVTEHELAETKAEFIERGFIDDAWNLINWDRRQYVSDSSTERTRRYRERKRTSRERHCDGVDTDTDTDTDTEQIHKNLPREVPARVVVDSLNPAKRKIAEAEEWFRTSFWPVWPVKENKTAAMKSAVKIEAEERAAVIAGVRAWIPRILSMERPIHASTWLNNRRWEDERSVNLFSNGHAPHRQSDFKPLPPAPVYTRPED